MAGAAVRYGGDARRQRYPHAKVGSSGEAGGEEATGESYGGPDIAARCMLGEAFGFRPRRECLPAFVLRLLLRRSALET